MRFAAFCMVMSFSLCGCGEYQGIDVCRRAQIVRMKTIIAMCEGWESKDCPWPCACKCVDQGGDFVMLVDTGTGLPILADSPCLLDVPCDGQAKESSEACLEDPETCATKWAQGFNEDFDWYGVRLCGEGTPIEDPFPAERCVYSSDWQEPQEL